jgi:hypothetical protein
LEKIRPAIGLCAKTLFTLIKAKFDQPMIVTMMSSWLSIDPIFIWMIRHQLLPQEGMDFLIQKATTPLVIKNHFSVYQVLFEKHDFSSCSTEVRTGYLTQYVAKRGQLQAKQLKSLYFKNKKPFDIGLLYDDLLAVSGQTPETALTLISELHRINGCPLMTFNPLFFRQLFSNVAEAEKILAIMFHRETKAVTCYLSTKTIEQIITIASDVLTDKRQCAKFLMPLVSLAARDNICKSTLIDLAQHTQDSSFSNRLLSALPSFDSLSELRRALLPRLFVAVSDYSATLQRWYVKNNVCYVREMHQDFQAINKEEMSLPMIKHFIQNKAYSMDIDSEVFPLIDGNHDIVCDLARLDNKITLKRYVYCIHANNIEYKMALFYQFPNVFGADDYYRAFGNYIDTEQFYTQYQYIESLLKNPQALLETLGSVMPSQAMTEQPLPSAPPPMPLMMVATAVFETDYSATAPIYAVAMPYPESLDMVYDPTQQKESCSLKPSGEEQQDNHSKLPLEKHQASEPERQEKSLMAQKILLAFAKVCLEKITSPNAIMMLTRQLKNEWLAHHFVQKSIDLMFQWAKVSLLFLELYQTKGLVNQDIMQFMEEDAQPSVKGLVGAWKSTMSAIGLSSNKYTLFYKAICSTNKVQADAFKMDELVTEQNNVAVQLDEALQP